MNFVVVRVDAHSTTNSWKNEYDFKIGIGIFFQILGSIFTLVSVLWKRKVFRQPLFHRAPPYCMMDVIYKNWTLPVDWGCMGFPCCFVPRQSAKYNVYFSPTVLNSTCPDTLRAIHQVRPQPRRRGGWIAVSISNSDLMLFSNKNDVLCHFCSQGERGHKRLKNCGRT